MVKVTKYNKKATCLGLYGHIQDHVLQLQ